ncbi:hypothetical protein [Telluria aromaticivorans]|uniref:Uncharacterized protein n=1 Tax=Telluria aromaticivorans TaxID=2725995 RepID=A0A7Y2K1D0_9BURK|nr:hypothetical protein [Telluria aromaticivorans]NNG24280.1 hypothetical protein [Telluria aromaticivorans]
MASYFSVACGHRVWQAVARILQHLARHNLLFSLSRGDWTVNLAKRYMSHYTDQNSAVEPEFFNTVGHHSTWSLSGTYTGDQAGGVHCGHQEPVRQGAALYQLAHQLPA